MENHKGLSLGKLISICSGILLLTVVVSFFVYSQSGERLKGQTPVLTHMVAPQTEDSTSIVKDSAQIEVTADKSLLESAGGAAETTTGSGIAGVSQGIDTSIIASDIVKEQESVLSEAVTAPDIIKDITKSDLEGIYRDDSEMIPLAPEAADSLIPQTSMDTKLQQQLLDAFGEACDQYKAELDYAYYHDDWIGSEKSYAVSMTNLKNGNCLSECEYAFYDGLLQLHYENYMVDREVVFPDVLPPSAKKDILTIISSCSDKCDRLYDLYAFFVDYAKSQSVYSQTDKDMMHYLIDSNINTCQMCVELENPVFNETKYFTKEFESVIDNFKADYGDLYLKTIIDLPDVPREMPNLYESGLTYNLIPTAYAATELTSSDVVFSEIITASASVDNDINSYLEDKCPEPVAPAACTEVHFVDPGNPATRINSFDAVYNERIENEPLLVQATGISGNVRYQFSTDTPIDPIFQFSDTVNTGNPLITSSPNVNLSSTDIVVNMDVISVKIIDENNNTVGTCTDQIALMLADSAAIAEAPVEEFGESYAPPEEETSTTTSSTTTTTTTSTSGGGTSTTSSTTSSSSGTTTGGGTSGGVAGGTLPRCNSLEITRPDAANAAGVPTVAITDSGYRNEILNINLSTDSGVVSKLRFKSLNGNITFNNQGTTVDLPPTTTFVRMNGGPAAGEEDTVTVWALNSTNQGIQSCHDGFIVTVPSAQVAGAPAAEEEPSGAGAVIPESHPAAAPTTAPLPVVHEGAETVEEVEDLPPTTPDDGPGVLVYFLGAGLGGLIFSRKKKNK